MSKIEDLKKLDKSLDKALDIEREEKKSEQNRSFFSNLFDTAFTALINVFQKESSDTRTSLKSLESKLDEQSKSFDKSIKTVADKKIDITVPEIKIPEIKIPEIKLPVISVPRANIMFDTKELEKTLREEFGAFKPPIVTVPKPEVTVNVPKSELKWPKGKLPVSGDIGLRDVDMENPLPVQLRDSNGKPVSFGGSGISGGSKGYKSVKLEGPNGDTIDAEPDHLGKYHLMTSINQDVNVAAGNSSSTNLAAGATWTGEAVSTLGVVGLQWNLYATENCTIYSEESPDGTNWDISYPFNYIASKGGQGETVQATQAYWRLRVTNNGTIPTTTFRVSGILCPIATPLPSSLTDDSRLKTETTLTGRHNTDRHAWINPTNEQAVSPVYRMVGTAFDGTVKDINFWTELLGGTVTQGSVTQGGGEIEVKTSTAVDGWAKYTSVRKARFVAGSAMLFQGGFNFKTIATAGNIRRCGAYTTGTLVNTPVDGFYFELNNATFSVNSRANSGVVSSIASGSFNGEYGASWTPTADTYYNLAIEYSPLGVFFYVNNKILHKKPGAHQSYFLTLPITIENIKTSGATDINFETVGMYIARQGELLTNPTSYYHAYGATAGVNLKIGSGVIHTIIFGGAQNNAIVTLSDSTTAATPALYVYTATGALSVPISIDMGGIPFNDGLRLTIANSAACTIVYE